MKKRWHCKLQRHVGIGIGADATFRDGRVYIHIYALKWYMYITYREPPAEYVMSHTQPEVFKRYVVYPP